jgi:predicted DNA binding CopG/RHH family protein
MSVIQKIAKGRIMKDKKKTKIVTIRLSEEDYANLKRAAAQKRLPVSAFARMVIMEEAEKQIRESGEEP